MGETQEVITSGSTKRGGKEEKAGRKRMSGRRGFGEKRQKSNRKNRREGGMIRGHGEHKERPGEGSNLFSSDGGGSGRRRRRRENVENRDKRQKGGGQSNSALAASIGGRQDGCRGRNTRPTMVNRTQLWPTFPPPKCG